MPIRIDFHTLPKEVQDFIRPHLIRNQDVVDSISQIVADKRDAAVMARRNSGVEFVWSACEEAYAGVDDANRGEFMNSRYAKPSTMAGPLTKEELPQNSRKSTAFVRLTGRYVEAAAAKLTEILIPVDDKSFSIKATPVPEMIAAEDDARQVTTDDGVPLTRPQTAAETAQPGSPPGAAPVPSPAVGGDLPAAGQAGAQQQTTTQPDDEGRVPLRVKDLVEEAVSIASKRAERAERRIYDWLMESRYATHMRNVIKDSARIGTGVMKGPFPELRRTMAIAKNEDGTVSVEALERIFPGATWVDPWNFYPDPACGECIHNGDHALECDSISEHKLIKLADQPGYIYSQIQQVVLEGPERCNIDKDTGKPDDLLRERNRDKKQFKIWYYHGFLTREELDCLCEAAGVPRSGDKDKMKSLPVVVTMVNDRVVKAALAPLDSGVIPYYVMPWTKRIGSWTGIGVGEQVNVPQRILNATVRSMMNNAGLSAGVQIVLDKLGIVPEDDDWEIVPNKIWARTAEASGKTVEEAFHVFKIDNVTQEMMLIIEWCLKTAEESTSIPLVTQGQTGPTTPETLGATQIQNSNANQLLRDIAATFDDKITEPMIRNFYEWLLLDPRVPADEKGDFQIVATGSSALVERAIQAAFIAQIGVLVKDPAYGGDPKRWFAEYLRANRLDPEKFKFTEQELKAIQSQPPPKAPAVEAAEIRAGVEEKKIAAKSETDKANIEVKREDVHSDRVVALHEIREWKEIEMLKYANANNMKLVDVQKELAVTRMKLDAQREMSEAENVVQRELAREGKKGGDGREPDVVEPPVQLPGRAANGEAFTQEVRQ